jgi:hypothetical protein
MLLQQQIQNIAGCPRIQEAVVTRRHPKIDRDGRKKERLACYAHQAPQGTGI